MSRDLTIGQLARKTRVNLETIRYYERIGLMPAPGRTGAGHRAYSTDNAQRLIFIRRGRELGFGLHDIRALLALAEPERSTCDEVEAIATAHLRNVRAKIDDLRRLERILTDTVGRCAGGRSPRCEVLEVLKSEG